MAAADSVLLRVVQRHVAMGMEESCHDFPLGLFRPLLIFLSA